MENIVFFDLEINPQTKKILDIGASKMDDSRFHSPSSKDFEHFVKGVTFIAGHNIINHDLKYLKDKISRPDFPQKIIDTLPFSPLLFPKKPYHRLLKDDKLQTEEKNNPLNDAQKAKELFLDECKAFNKLADNLKIIFYHLLKKQKEFKDFFLF